MSLISAGSISLDSTFKGTVSQDFLILVFFMNQFPLSPRVSHDDRCKFVRKFAEIFACQGAPPAEKLTPVSTTPAANLPPVSTTPAANFATSFASVVYTSGNFAVSGAP
jgi:hypothetical protein